MEPADRRGGWLVDDCKTVAGEYGKLVMNGSMGAIVGRGVQITVSESKE
jgi:hypothetical protein